MLRKPNHDVRIDEARRPMRGARRRCRCSTGSERAKRRRQKAHSERNGYSQPRSCPELAHHDPLSTLEAPERPPHGDEGILERQGSPNRSFHEDPECHHAPGTGRPPAPRDTGQVLAVATHHVAAEKQSKSFTTVTAGFGLPG